MANITNTKIEKVKREISKIKSKIEQYQNKISEYQTKLRELERQKTKLEDSEIVSMYRNNSERFNEDIFQLLCEESATSKVSKKKESGTYEE
ncbi:hypothetical protein FACS189499_10550 [Clostridia bacterium]|nr:hypothetical protein FACS189499_10550 [Clostridia bacterium]